MPKINRATQLTLFATGLMLMAIFVLYIMLVAEFGIEILRMYHFVWLIVAAALFAYVVSAIIIDQVLNPMRLMVAKVREIGDMNFAKPLVISDDDEELREYAFQFNNMAQKLNQYIERQKRFVSDASHELSTPITIINGHADLLLRHGINGDPALLENGLSTIKQEILRMNNLVESLLTLARNDSNHENYTFRPTNMTALLTDAAQEMKTLAPNFIFKVNAGENIIVNCDEYAIKRVMRIILTNAIRHTAHDSQSAPASKIEIGATMKNGVAEVYVKDNGTGIPEAHLSKIFRRFYRVDASRSKKTGSSGLGLAIAREIINAHGGGIFAKSPTDWGCGTEICFKLPS